VTGKEVKVLM